MSKGDIVTYIILITAAASYINNRYIRLPQPIGITLLTVFFSLCLIFISKQNSTVHEYLTHAWKELDISKAIMDGMLGFLLFAGSLHINLWELVKYRWIIATLATIGVLISTLLIGFASFYFFNFIGYHISLLYCLVFGALISPTDPIAVLSILKRLNAPKSLEMKIAGESLFNDGVGIVVFTTFLELAKDRKIDITPYDLIFMLTQEIIGAVVLGYLLGFLVSRILRKVANFDVAVLMTIALVTSGSMFANLIHASGPITMVVAGLCIGHYMRSGHMLENVINRLDAIWALIDDVLNSILFVLIGLELIDLQLKLNFSIVQMWTGIILIVLLARIISIAFPVFLVRRFRQFKPYVTILTWGGIRGGVSIALALSLPDSDVKSLILKASYAVVIFSIVIQGLTLGKLIKYKMMNKSFRKLANNN